MILLATAIFACLCLHPSMALPTTTNRRHEQTPMPTGDCTRQPVFFNLPTKVGFVSGGTNIALLLLRKNDTSPCAGMQVTFNIIPLSGSPLSTICVADSDNDEHSPGPALNPMMMMMEPSTMRYLCLLPNMRSLTSNAGVAFSIPPTGPFDGCAPQALTGAAYQFTLAANPLAQPQKLLYPPVAGPTAVLCSNVVSMNSIRIFPDPTITNVLVLPATGQVQINGTGLLGDSNLAAATMRLYNVRIRSSVDTKCKPMVDQSTNTLMMFSCIDNASQYGPIVPGPAGGIQTASPLPANAIADVTLGNVFVSSAPATR